MRSSFLIALLAACSGADDTADTDTDTGRNPSCDADAHVYVLLTADSPVQYDQLMSYWIDAPNARLESATAHLVTSGSSQGRTAMTLVGDRLYVGHSEDPVIDGYALDSCGVPTALPGSPFDAAGASTWLSQSPDGTRLFAATSGLIHAYAIGADGGLVLTDTQTAGVDDGDLQASWDGGTLFWVGDAGMRRVPVDAQGHFGTLQSSSMIALADPGALALHPDGTYLYVRERGSGWHRVHLSGNTLLYDGLTPGGEGTDLAFADERVWTLDTFGQVRAWEVGPDGDDLATEASGSPWTTRADAQYLALDREKGWAFTSHPEGDRVQGFTFDGTGGLATWTLHTLLIDDLDTSAGPVVVR